MIKRVALAGPLYSGKTTLLHHLGEHGYQTLGLSATLAKAYVKWVNEVEGKPLTLEQLYDDKATHRLALQQFGARMGFDSERVPFWIDQTMIDERARLGPNDVIAWDSVRFPAQAVYLKQKYGFTIVHIQVPEDEIIRRGRLKGVNEDRMRKALTMPSEQKLPRDLIDLELDGLRDTDWMAMQILTIRL